MRIVADTSGLDLWRLLQWITAGCDLSANRLPGDGDPMAEIDLTIARRATALLA